MQENHRNIIYLEDSEVLSHEAFDGDQYVIRLHSPQCAAAAEAGQFANLQCDPQRLMRRPLSIMRVSKEQGWVEYLYKDVGEGTHLLAQRKVGEFVSSLGPVGRPYEIHPERPKMLLLGGGVGIPPMLCLSESIKNSETGNQLQPLVFMGSEVPFPFQQQKSELEVKGVPASVIHSLPLLESWGIPSRLASMQGYEGAHKGYITDLARLWLQQLSASEKAEVEIFACGPTPMLAAVAALAKEFDLPCQVSLEEHMACAVGGCAGCVVKVKTPEGDAMKRICVDGPVFEAKDVFA